MVARAGADAIGLNFYARSPRHVDIHTARRIVATLPRAIIKVGLFVNAAADDVCRLCDELRLDLIQLHGDERPEYLGQIQGRAVLRAFRVGAEGLRPVTDYLAQCRALGVMPSLVLLDAQVPGEFGGTGQTTDWSLAASYAQQAEGRRKGRQQVAAPASGITAPGQWPPLVLAGGLTPANVAEAVRRVRPAAVDTASGVESSPGHKDPAAVAAFVEAARSGGAWAAENATD